MMSGGGNSVVLCVIHQLYILPDDCHYRVNCIPVLYKKERNIKYSISQILKGSRIRVMPRNLLLAQP